jgi:TAG lipase/steryl ester hydrolase/phospholipase A2/LPA acyltransferase
LFLSGGAGFGKYHHGFLKALHEVDLLPSIIVGASAGSVVASCICTLRRDEVDMIGKFEYMYSRKLV